MQVGTYFTIWHYGVIGLCIFLLILATMVSFKEKRSSVRNSLIFSSFLVLSLVGAFLIMALDKYTKIAEVTNLKNRRVLSNETIVYSGIVSNRGEYTIGEVTFELKLVNKGHVTGNVKAGSFYKPSGLFDFMGNVSGQKETRAQSVLKTFVIAKNLEAGKSKAFSVTLKYPPYFKHTSYFVRTFAH